MKTTLLMLPGVETIEVQHVPSKGDKFVYARYGINDVVQSVTHEVTPTAVLVTLSFEPRPDIKKMALEIVAQARNKQEPGPVFAALNEVLGEIWNLPS
ncbi:hypothetical protein RCDURKIN_2 [Rhodobacter phage RcDurkin]|nr:hypothetical protein RCDURKIN_2 [Rhodobacter phage RcDurkin]UUV43746.1 hypothetical protein RCKICKAPOO_5 [Rhodobacter phage RcKickapoo]UUV44373.1 hypothetical protein RCMENCHIE_4 [Rhodobacter phage RcMenchie]